MGKFRCIFCFVSFSFFFEKRCRKNQENQTWISFVPFQVPPFIGMAEAKRGEKKILRLLCDSGGGFPKKEYKKVDDQKKYTLWRGKKEVKEGG